MNDATKKAIMLVVTCISTVAEIITAINNDDNGGDQ